VINCTPGAGSYDSLASSFVYAKGPWCSSRAYSIISICPPDAMQSAVFSFFKTSHFGCSSWGNE